MKAFCTTLILLSLVFSSAEGQVNKRIGRTPAVTNDWRSGFINITEVNGALGLSSTAFPFSKNYFGITTVNGYQFSRNMKGGVGVGLQFHNGGMLLPLFVDGRFNFSSQELVPFLGIAGGVALSPEDLNNQSRVFINPSAGIRFVARQKLSFTFSVGLMTQAGGVEMRSSFINFKLGTEFKGPRWD